MPINNEQIPDFNLGEFNKNRVLDIKSQEKFFDAVKKDGDIKRLEDKIDQLTDLIKLIFGKSVLVNGSFVDISKIDLIA